VLPHFLIIGTKKGGTTSLHRYLSFHPQLFLPALKELMFFNSKNWHRGREWYERFFVDDGRTCGEATPDYTWFPREKDVPARIHALIPHCKLVYIIRDPVERMLSNHSERVGSLHECREFSEIIDTPEYEIYFEAGRYFAQIQQYLAFFPARSIHVMTLENLAENPQREIRQLCAFLGVEPDAIPSSRLEERLNTTPDKRRRNAVGRLLYSPRMQQRLNGKLPWRVHLTIERIATWRGETIRKPVLSDAHRERLAGRFRDDFRRLQDFTGMAFSNWKNIEYLR